MRCYKCGSILLEDSSFCQFCGEELHKQNFCPACGAEITQDGSFCSRCGKRLSFTNETDPVAPVPASKTPKEAKRWLLVSLIAVSIAALAAVAFFLGCTKDEEIPVYTAADAAESVLLLECYDSTGDLLSTGSGFLIEDGKTLVTNHHVIENVHNIKVFDSHHRYAAKVSEVRYLDEDLDLAVLGVDQDTLLQPLELGDSAAVCQGDRIYAIGYPLSMENTLSDGIVSAVLTNDDVDMLQITAPVSSGSSGGPLLDENCRVVGVVVSTYVDGQNMNNTIAVHELQNLMKSYQTPVRLDELYLQTHPQLAYDSYTVGMKTMRVSDEKLLDEILTLWEELPHTEEYLELLLQEYFEVGKCVYLDELQYAVPGEWDDETDMWAFDPDRTFGDVHYYIYKDEAYVFFFYEVIEGIVEEPEEEAREQSADTEPSVEKQHEEVPVAEKLTCAHIWSVWSVKMPSGCTVPGNVIKCCSVCHTSKSEPIAAKGHREVVDTAMVHPTCTADGAKESSHCSVCGAVLRVAEPIPATGHEYVYGVCSDCDQADPDYVSALTEESLQGKWMCGGIDGIYGKSIQMIFDGNHFSHRYWSGEREDRQGTLRIGTFTVSGMSIIFSDGITEWVSYIDEKYMTLNGLTYTKVG